MYNHVPVDQVKVANQIGCAKNVFITLQYIGRRRAIAMMQTGQPAAPTQHAVYSFRPGGRMPSERTLRNMRRSREIYAGRGVTARDPMFPVAAERLVRKMEGLVGHFALTKEEYVAHQRRLFEEVDEVRGLLFLFFCCFSPLLSQGCLTLLCLGADCMTSA